MQTGFLKLLRFIWQAEDLNGSCKLKSYDVAVRTRLKILKRNIFDIRIHAIYFPVDMTETRIALFRDYALSFPALFQPSLIRERTNGINFALCADPESGSGGFCELRAKETSG